MSEYKRTEAIIDGVLKTIMVSGVISTALVAPNMAQALDKPMRLAFKKMDERARKREIQRVLYYMKRQKLIEGNYNHGLRLTKKGKQRLKKISEEINLKIPNIWDKKWRLVFYDIPEESGNARRSLKDKLKALGFIQLQRSVWVFPHECKDEIAVIASRLEINQFVSYITTYNLDNPKPLIKEFKKKGIL